jgi:hypothetical protein
MTGGRVTCENCPSIDVRSWSRAGKLWPTTEFSESWTFEGRPIGSISVANEPNLVSFSFVYREDASSEWKKVSQRLRIIWSGCAFGGGRPWLQCPVHECGRRIAIVYLGRAPLFACRKCHDLAYATQFEP